MGLFDKLKGVKRPEDGVEAQAPATLRQALLDAATDKPFTVREDSEGEADLIAEWRIDEPEWQTRMKTRKVDRHLQILMRLDEAEQEVRALDKTFTVTWTEQTGGAGVGYELKVDAEASRGVSTSASFGGTISLGGGDGPTYEEIYSFSSGDMKDPLRDTTVANGWTWRGVAFGKL